MTQLWIGVHAWFNQWQLGNLGYMIQALYSRKKQLLKKGYHCQLYILPQKCLLLVVFGYVLVIEKWTLGRFKRKGTYVYLWLIHVDIWQKPTQLYKAIILQFKNK